MAGPFPGWTSHGHPIPGVSRSEDMRPPIARCGGPRLCVQCAREAVRLPGTAETEQTTLEGQDKLRRLEDRKGLRRLTEPAEDLTEPEEGA